MTMQRFSFIVHSLLAPSSGGSQSSQERHTHTGVAALSSRPSRRSSQQQSCLNEERGCLAAQYQLPCRRPSRVRRIAVLTPLGTAIDRARSASSCSWLRHPEKTQAQTAPGNWLSTPHSGLPRKSWPERRNIRSTPRWGTAIQDKTTTHIPNHQRHVPFRHDLVHVTHTRPSSTHHVSHFAPPHHLSAQLLERPLSLGLALK